MFHARGLYRGRAVRAYIKVARQRGSAIENEVAILELLDFELAGRGNRDFDIAWALLLRPGQRFLRTEAEQTAFLEGYAALGDFDLTAVRRYMAQCYVYFLQFSGDDGEYCDYVRGWLERV